MSNRSSVRLYGIILFALCPLALAQNFTVIHAFSGPPSDGANPFAGLTFDGAALYGTTETGGGSCCGTIFKLTGNGLETVLYNFTGGADQGFPAGTLIRDAAGNLYGTAQHGERSGAGSVFQVTPSGQLTTLYQFTNGTDGGYPLSGLIRDENGNLYGTASSGGVLSCNGGGGCGVVFKVDPAGKENVLYAFDAIAGGQFPASSLVHDGAGNLYGTTPTGGNTACNAPYGCGVVFMLSPTGKETVLHTFAGGSDGAFPEAGLTLDSRGGAYGTTVEGGGTGCLGIGCGIVFRINRSGFSIVYRFRGSPDGAYPDANVVTDPTGNVYGTTEYGGSTECAPLGCGTVFKLDGTGKESVLHTFHMATDGGAPLDPLVRDRAGNLYGTTSNWGPSTCNQYGCGTVFRLTP